MNSAKTGEKPFANMRSKAPESNQVDTVAANIKRAVDKKPSPKPITKSKAVKKQERVSYDADTDILAALRKKKEEDGIPVNNFINRVLRKELGL